MMPRWLRILLIAGAGAVGLFALVLALAWAFLPREWISREAQRQATQMTGASVRWNALTPGFEQWSLGIRISDFSVRMPAKGPPAVEARVKEIFVRFRLLPLLVRRVEVSAASIRHASVAMVDRGTRPGSAPAGGESGGAPGVALVLPRLEMEDVTLSSRDQLGGGFDLRRISGHTSFEGALPLLRSLAVDLKAESLLWKPSARDPLVALPGPAHIDLELHAANGGARLAVTRGSLDVGPLRSAVTGGVDLKSSSPGKAPALDLRIQGKPQEVRSEDAAFRSLAARMPATWKGTASWDVRVGGAAGAPSTEGEFTVKPLRVEANKNVLSFDAIEGNWSTAADQTYSANVTGSGTGVHLELTARGSTRPGGSSDGTLLVRAPAARLNGFVPDAPTWQSGDLECRAVFQLRPPAPPDVRWTVTGRGLNGTVPGLPGPISGFDFHLDGDAAQANVRDLTLKVGSTIARVTGTVKQEKPLGTGTFDIRLDRFVAEEWAPPKGPATTRGKARPVAPTAVPPIPLRSLDATVRIGEVRSGGMTIRDLVAPVRFANGALSVSPIQGVIGSGTVAGGLDVRSLLKDPSYALRLDVKRAPVEQVASGVLPFRAAVTGFLTGSIDLSGPGLPSPAVSDSLRGSLAGTVEQGALVPSPAITKIQAALGLNSDAAGIAFRTISHSLRIERGRLLVDKVKGDLGLDRFDMTGSMGMDQTLNLAVHLSLAPQRVKGGGSLTALARYARDAEGRIPLDLQVTGSAVSPTISLKAGKALEAATERLKQDLGSQLMKGLAPRGPAPDSTRSSRPDTTAKDALEKGREALKRLLGK